MRCSSSGTESCGGVGSGGAWASPAGDFSALQDEEAEAAVEVVLKPDGRSSLIVRLAFWVSFHTRPSCRAIFSQSRRWWPGLEQIKQIMLTGHPDDKWPWRLHMEQVIIRATMSLTMASNASADSWEERGL